MDNRFAYVENKRIEFRFPFQWDVIYAIRDIAGSEFDKKNRTWSVPFTAWHGKKVIETLAPLGFHIDPEISIQQYEKIVPPGIKLPNELYPFQKEGVEFIIRTGGRCILADDMGLGKTITALAYVGLSKGRTLVVSPANVTYKWLAECEKWLPKRKATVIDKGKQEMTDGDIDIMSYSIMVNKYDDLVKRPYDIIICDESHYIKNSKAQRTRVAKALIRSTSKVLFLSGTPFMNHPSELYPMLNLLDPIGYPNYYKYAQRYCNPPEAPIWMGDFSFKSLGDLKVGDEVIGWKQRTSPAKKNIPAQYMQDELCRAKVLAIHKRISNLIKITLESGRIIRCTPDHKWRSANIGHGSPYEYKEAKVGSRLCFAVEPSYPKEEARWLAGIYDGEGCGETIAQSKTHNPVLCSAIEDSLTNLGFSYSFHNDKYAVLGGMPQYVKFINELNPIRRNSSRLDKLILTSRPRNADRIVSIEPDGEGEVISMTTETGNYVAWGYESKNCGARYEMGTWFFPPGGTSNLGELATRLQDVMIRHTKQEVLKDLPELSRTLVPVSIDNLSEYKQAVRDMKQWLKEHDKDVADPNHILTRLNVLRQIAGEGKITSAVELAESVLQAGRKVVLFAHHRDVVDRLYEALKSNGCLKIVGDTPAKERSKNSNLFLSLDSPVRVMIISVAGAEGIDLYSSSDVIFVEREWTPAREEQAEARLHRIGQKSSVQAWYLVAKHTVDEKLAKIVDEKRKIFGQVIRQDEIIRQILEDLEA